MIGPSVSEELEITWKVNGKEGLNKKFTEPVIQVAGHLLEYKPKELPLELASSFFLW